MKRKIACLLIMAMMLAAFSGCGEKKASEPENSEVNKTTAVVSMEADISGAEKVPEVFISRKSHCL